MRADSFAAKVLGNLARTSPPFSTGPAHVPARATQALSFRSWLLHALAFAPVSDDNSPGDAMRAAYRNEHTSGFGHPTGSTATLHESQEQSTGPRSPAEMVARARQAVETAHAWDEPLRQYTVLYYAAQYATDAVLMVRKRPEHQHGRRARVRNEWKVLIDVAPDLSEFAEYFDKTTVTYIRAREGMSGAVGTEELEELRQMATRFMDGVEALTDVRNATAAPGRDKSSGRTTRRIS